MKKYMQKDLLKIEVYDTRHQMGTAAANAVAGYITDLKKRKSEINIIFAAAPSQNEFLAELKTMDLPWGNINAFHMDEYIGLDENAPQRFGNFLRDRIFADKPFQSVNYLYNRDSTPEDTCKRYAELLSRYPADIIFMGIGENGHIAFNDPPVAKFDDPEDVKTVKLDMMCRNQQVNDGCFETIGQVPTHAITITIPAMMRAEKIFCIVPAASKANAIRAVVKGGITTECPASILRRHPDTTLFCDAESAKYII